MFDLVRDELIQDAVKVVHQLEGEFDPRHAYRARRRGLGRLARLPETRRSRYLRISDHVTVFREATMPA
jgi:hypothetical protein